MEQVKTLEQINAELAAARKARAEIKRAEAKALRLQEREQRKTAKAAAKEQAKAAAKAQRDAERAAKKAAKENEMTQTKAQRAAARANKTARIESAKSRLEAIAVECGCTLAELGTAMRKFVATKATDTPATV